MASVGEAVGVLSKVAVKVPVCEVMAVFCHEPPKVAVTQLPPELEEELLLEDELEDEELLELEDELDELLEDEELELELLLEDELLEELDDDELLLEDELDEEEELLDDELEEEPPPIPKLHVVSEPVPSLLFTHTPQ
jgi:hypothetical protein